MTDEPGPPAALSGLSLGVFAADLGQLREAARQAAAWGAAALHFDVMDGVFTPAITGGPGFVAALDVGSPRDVHLMVDAPSRKIAAFAEAGADIISVHAEAPDAREAMGRIREASVRLRRPILAGLALMPDSSVDSISDLLEPAPDVILVLAVDPRKKAPPVVDLALAKLAALKERPWKAAPRFVFDGAVTLSTIEAVAAGAPDLIVSGSAVFAAPDPPAAFARLAAALQAAAAARSRTGR